MYSHKCGYLLQLSGSNKLLCNYCIDEKGDTFLLMEKVPTHNH